MATHNKNQTSNMNNSVELIVSRALTDAAFRDLFFKDQSTALKEYKLSSKEKEALSLLSRSSLEQAITYGLCTGATC